GIYRTLAGQTSPFYRVAMIGLNGTYQDNSSDATIVTHHVSVGAGDPGPDDLAFRAGGTLTAVVDASGNLDISPTQYSSGTVGAIRFGPPLSSVTSPPIWTARMWYSGGTLTVDSDDPSNPPLVTIVGTLTAGQLAATDLGGTGF